MEFFSGESPCPPKFVIDTETGVTKEITEAYKSLVQKDMALLSLLIATLSDDVMEYVIGCKTSLIKVHFHLFLSLLIQLKLQHRSLQLNLDNMHKQFLLLILGSGASHHMTPNLRNLNQPVQFNGKQKITIGNSEGLTVKHIGSVTLSTPQHLLFLRNILHVPTISQSFICKETLQG